MAVEQNKDESKEEIREGLPVRSDDMQGCGELAVRADVVQNRNEIKSWLIH